MLFRSTINRNGSNVAHHTSIWFIDSELQSSSGLSCGASPKDVKAAVVKAGGLLAFHHPEYTYIEDAEKHKDKTPSATALKYTLPKDQCDLVGSTSISAKLDAEEWRDLVRSYLDAASEAVTEMGGHVAKELGHALMALFGYPVAQENDAERAARAPPLDPAGAR